MEENMSISNARDEGNEIISGKHGARITVPERLANFKRRRQKNGTYLQ